MTGKELIKKIMEEEQVTNAQLANRIGVTQATMWARLNYQNAKDVSLSVFTETLTALGYEVIVRKRNVPAEQREIVVDIEETEKPERRGRPRKEDPTPVKTATSDQKKPDSKKSEKI